MRNCFVPDQHQTWSGFQINTEQALDVYNSKMCLCQINNRQVPDFKSTTNRVWISYLRKSSIRNLCVPGLDFKSTTNRVWMSITTKLVCARSTTDKFWISNQQQTESGFLNIANHQYVSRLCQINIKQGLDFKSTTNRVWMSITTKLVCARSTTDKFWISNHQQTESGFLNIANHQ